ncbi:hypothetical protein QGP82_23840 [Leptothoe sp. LEGE 181152]|nr:hypothetical protein [Leptothoe sp. LEGE 181152]
MAKSTARTQNKKRSGLQGMKLVAIKQECYAISGAATTKELKRKYKTLCQGRDFRRRKTWEYVLKKLRQDGDWIGLSISDIEERATRECSANKPNRSSLVFHPERVAMDQAADNDD